MGWISKKLDFTRVSMAKPKNQPKPSEDRPKRKIPDKCVKCALLDMDRVRELHGGEKGCWNPKVCDSRRSHAKNRDRRNAARNLKNRKKDSPQEMGVPEPDLLYAVLIEYRFGAFGDSRLHALGAEIWNAEDAFDFIKPRHCEGMTPTKVYQEVDKFLVKLNDVHGLKNFAVRVRLDVEDCPIRPCPHHSAGRRRT
jgi:hypothetical protein